MNKPARCAQPWTAAEDMKMAAAYESGKTPAAIAADLQRTVAGVCARLTLHGYQAGRI